MEINFFFFTVLISHVLKYLFHFQTCSIDCWWILKYRVGFLVLLQLVAISEINLFFINFFSISLKPPKDTGEEGEAFTVASAHQWVHLTDYWPSIQDFILFNRFYNLRHLNLLNLLFKPVQLICSLISDLRTQILSILNGIFDHILEKTVQLSHYFD
jgi:hypothetical protein